MNSAKAVKLLGLIIGIVVLNIAVLSPGLLGVEIGGDSVLETASGITLLVVSFLVLLYGSYTLLIKPPYVPPVREVRTHEDYVAALAQFRNVKGLKKEIALALDQLDRIDKKKDTLLDVLEQRFDPSELSYKKFISVIDEVRKLFYLNIRGILNKLSVFDAQEFASFAGQQHKPGLFSNRLVQEKAALYQEYMAHMSGYLGVNEEILLKLDKLLLEISLLGSTDYRDVDDMPCMKEIDQLIKQTKFYKQ
ncbi:hypothetical protein D3P07_24325 [Paenibacillus sp. 1011MAR3C5]|uniref:hypothetical protein n=1 Tax=Paenibacillus sp. 1011MAR3C5 TaxID=1675787 RepID=UPI000E6D50B1|nr:hypothetical protein [Paenibacillus sp. 1011MAR3C5]RJE83937.1 hypothetical protein D3P07_24325 [Paenibacillus sp. 1011MAR3C5]